MNQVAPIEFGIPVKDLDRMLSFYSEVLACKEVRRADIPPALSDSLSVAPNGYVNVWLEFPNGEVLKLMAPPETPADDAVPPYIGTRTGIAYFTVYLSDIADTLAKAERHGTTVISDRGLAETPDALKLAFLKDPEGNVFELVEPAPR